MLPPQAHLLEKLRRSIYDLHLGWGYAPVYPPFVEFLDSLLSTAGRDFDRQTFKIADPVSGRMMGLRADMTPQVARIDAHQLEGQGIARLFYMGTVVRAFGESSGGNRSPLQLGAELFGHSGSASDVEIIRLMLATLDCVGLQNVHLDVGHVGIFRHLSERLELTSHDQASLFELLQRKAESDIAQLAGSLGVNDKDREILCNLCSLNGDVSVLERARNLLAGYGDGMLETIDTLRTIGHTLSSLPGRFTVHYDLAELRGYQYHNGIVFAAYVPGAGTEVARGGRYDGIGEVFGRARPATGYSTDLKALMRITGVDNAVNSGDERPLAILAPDEMSEALHGKVAELRAGGEVVITNLGGGEQAMCDRRLILKNGTWSLEHMVIGEALNG